MHDSLPLTRRQFLHTTAALAVGATQHALSAGASAAPAPAPAGPWQIGCYTRPFDQFEYRVALDAIAEAGFKHVGLMTAKGKHWIMVGVDTPLEEAATIGAEVKRRGLKAVSLYGGDFPVATSVAAGIAGLKKLIDNCVACGAGNLMVGGTGNAALQSAYYKVVAECCAYAAEKGVGLSVKPHGGLNATGPQCRKLIEQVGRKNFRLWYDPGNIYYYSDGRLDPVADAATVDGLVVGMSVKDYRHPKDVMVTPGTGQVDFPKVLARLRQGGFARGPLVVECLAPGDLNRIKAEARKARRFLEELTR
ncbi:MAG: sugar phosphate isomerase/epimerase [Verrucomicrobia bacterium]|nr:sugar phosphate isomerase/epimerase [Verrucomicrobiota bacterium]